MQVQIQVKNLPKSSALRRYAKHKLDVALSRFAHAIQETTMRLTDINGPDRGGVDKLCRVMVTLKNDSVIVIEDLATNIMQAIDRATDRLHQSVSRQLSRIVKINRNGMRQSTLLLAEA
ncbi:MAG: HPF/RaiA family ribosome-associated protein [Betaproteobacteria bacterium]|nr:HPF/RaiA family ribosome-associated protein [Betaproteobacteria bacterium]